MISKRIISSMTIGFAALASIFIFVWPFVIPAQSANQAALAQSVFIGLMPMLLILVLVEFSSGNLGSKQLAALGVLIAMNAVIRVLGAGTAGIETAFFLIIIGAYVFGSGFGFLLGASSLLVSALLIGGIGPWLPFQMMAAGLVGLFAGFLPKPRSRRGQLALLVMFSLCASYAYGALMTVWNWPFLAGAGGSLGYIAGASVLENLSRFIQYELVSGGLLWDTGRAVTTIVLMLLTAPALLATLRRAAGRAGFEKRKS